LIAKHVNDDGLDDLIVGAYGASSNNKTEAGKSYVVFGKKDNTTINLSAIASGVGGFVIKGASKNDHSGTSVSSAGDVNGPEAMADRLMSVLSFLLKMT
jgi:hypothetical protein